MGFISILLSGRNREAAEQRQPSPEDHVRAVQRRPGARVSQRRAGRQVLQVQCTGFHFLDIGEISQICKAGQS